MEGEVLETSPLAGKALRDANLPNDIRIGAIIHEGEVKFPEPDLIVKTKTIGKRVRRTQFLVLNVMEMP